MHSQNVLLLLLPYGDCTGQCNALTCNLGSSIYFACRFLFQNLTGTLKTSQKAWYFVVFDTPVKTELKKSLDTADDISNINVLTVDSRSN